MTTIEYSVGMPLEMENPEQELNQRLAGTDMTWKPEFRNYYHICVPVDSDDEDVVLEQSARKVYAVFKDIANPEIDELPNPRTAHEIIKYYDKQHRRQEGCEGYIRNLGDGWARVFFTLIANSKVLDANKATADCDRQVAEIIEDQDMTAVIDIPARLGTLKKTGIPVHFVNYLIAVRVPHNEVEFEVLAAAAEKLWARVKGRPVYVELDDMGGELLEAIIKYHIPKRRR